MMLQVVQISSQNLLSGCSHLLKMRNKILSLQCFKRDDVKIKDLAVDGIGIMDLHYVEMLNVSLENNLQQCGTPVLPSQSQLIMLTTGGCTLLLLAAAGEAWLDTDRGWDLIQLSTLSHTNEATDTNVTRSQAGMNRKLIA